MPRPDHTVGFPAGSSMASAGEWPSEGGRRPPVQQLRFITQSPAEALEVLERVYAVRRMEVAPDAPFSMSQAMGAVERVSLERVHLTGAPATGLIDAPGVLRVARVLGGRLAFTDSTRTVPGPRPFLLPQRRYTCRWEELDLLTLSLDLSAVEAHAADLLGIEDFRLRFTGAETVSPGMALYLTTTMATFGQHQLSNEEAMGRPLARMEAFRSLATAVLHAFPGTFLDRSVVPVPERPAPAGVRRAVEFVQERAAEDIGLAEIAQAARLSPRGLQAAFRRELGTTPLAHLRAVRLEAAHRELQLSDPQEGASVASVASRWGFTHTGRFAAAYRERYGVNPAVILRS